MLMPTLFFKSRRLEDQFRAMVNKPTVVGGFIFIRWLKDTPISFSQMEKFNGNYPQMIDSWTIIPNLSAKPESYWSIDFELWDAFKKSVDMTAQSLSLNPIYFCTHPTGSSYPSGQDAAMALNHCQTMKNTGEMVIASLNPLRVHLYRIEKNELTVSATESGFLSWRMGSLPKLIKGNC